MFDKEKITQTIKNEAFKIGFDAVGFSPAKELTEDKEHLHKWLSEGFNAEMGYMAKNFNKRVNPSLLVDNSLSVISLLKNYYPADSKLSSQEFKIARYAYGIDYHVVIKEMMKRLFSFIKTELYPDLKGRCFVDSAPLLERALAVKAGLGWIGKNSMLINRNSGSYFFIGELLINLELNYNNTVIKESCGTCNQCIKSCPVNAITPHRAIDANKCISYHTIENKGIIPERIKEKINGWIFGCDICQEVCPWNKRANPTDIQEFQPSEKLKYMTKEDWQNLNQEQFNDLFKNSAVKRTGFSVFKKNIEIN